MKNSDQFTINAQEKSTSLITYQQSYPRGGVKSLIIILILISSYFISRGQSVCPSQGTPTVYNNQTSATVPNPMTGDVLISGNFTVVTSVNFFTIDVANIRLDPGSLIIVNAGCTLKIQNSCLGARNQSVGGMWDKIRVNDPTAKVIIDNSKISDASIGLHTLNGGEIELLNATFDRNQYHIWADNYGFSYPAKIDGCNFTSSLNYIGPTGSETEWAINAVDVFNFPVGEGTYGANNFKHCTIGINAVNSGLEVYNNSFDLIGTGINANNTSTQALSINIGQNALNRQNYFNDINVGIKVGSVSGLTSSKIIGNYMSMINKSFVIIQNSPNQSHYIGENYFNFGGPNINHIGISVLNCFNSNIIITQNGITYPLQSLGTAIRITNAAQSTYNSIQITDNLIQNITKGIWISNTDAGFSGAMISENSVYDQPGYNGPNGSGSIRLENCTGFVVFDNHLNLGSSGLVSVGNFPFGIRLDGASTLGNHDITCNEIFDLRDHIRIEGDLQARLSGNKMNGVGRTGVWVIGSITAGGDIGNQGSILQPSDNEWNATFQTACVLAENALFFDISHFRWFVRSGFYQYDPSNNNNISTNCVVRIATPWSPLFFLLNNNIPLLDCSDPSPFKPSTGGGGNRLADSDSLLFDPFLEVLNNSEWYTDKPEIIQWFLKEGLLLKTLEDSVFNEIHFQEIFGSSGILYNLNINTIYQAFKAITELRYSDAQGLISSITPINTPEILYKSYIEIYLEILQGENDELSDQQELTLRNIASLCPDEGGRAIYFARDVLRTFFPEEDFEDCISSQANKLSFTKVELSSNHFIVGPNPAKGFINISSLKDSEETVMLTCNSLQGKVILSKELDFENRITTIDLENVVPGIYFMELRFSKGTEIHKLIIQ